MHKVIKHYGTPRHSGRYPWGSGEDPQRSVSFLQRASELKKQGLSEVEIARGLGVVDAKGNPSTSKLRAKKSIMKSEQRAADAAEALRLKTKGYSNVEGARRMGINESSYRSLLNPVLQERSDITRTTADILKESVDKKGYIDVGLGVENHIGVSRTRLKTSIAMLEEEGYRVHKFDIEQLGTGKKTNMMVLTKEDVTYGEMLKNKDKIRMITDYSEDGGRSFLGLEPIRSVDSKRVAIRYAEDGGTNKDGVIELRRGVDDISLGNARYAQVRIAIDKTHYLKGMAMYSDDLPEGVDVMFNTNKKTNINKLAAMKVMSPDMNDPKAKDIQTLKISKEEKDNLLKKGVTDGSIKPDPDNPFGATVRQRHYIDSKGGTQLSTLNIVNEEGEWRDKWSKNLSSQMLSKQNPSLAKKQLGLTYDTKKEEYDEIISLTNPVVKKKLLDDFADGCDSSAVHLKAAALPRSSWHVILPIPSMKETEVYAPYYRDGERVVLIRYPHGGTFEIPELIVNNRHKVAKQTLADAKDAIGIHPKVAEKLSGADFDGDAVLVIPNSNKNVKTSSSLKSLSNFDPKESYPAYEGMPKISPRTKQMKMGDVSNLITDMTIRGADTDEIARAVKHSMVVIDSEKHHLDYKKSYVDNGIAGLKKRYQGSATSGASTLISRAASEKRVNVRKERIDPTTGKKMYEYTGETYERVKYRDPVTGKLKETSSGNARKKGYETISSRAIKKTISSTKMYETDNAFTLSSGTPMETIYAAHANKLKELANLARKDSVNTLPMKYSPSAKKVYESEVSSLKASLNLAIKNKPLERQAQLLANTVVSTKREANPDMDAADIKKVKGQALMEARTRTGAKKQQIEITDKQWEAIQAGAVSTNTLTQILNNTDVDKIKQLATPRTTKTMTTVKVNKAKNMLALGYTQAEVADQLGVSTSTLAKAVT